MKNKFIVDKEINLKESDFLKTEVYADNLTKIIKNTEPNKVFTIGLFGNWGTGKSSIIKTTQQNFEQKETKFITYDAWQYVNDSFRRMFLRRLREDLKYEETDLMRRFYENESMDIGNKYELSSTRLAFIIGGLILLLAMLILIPINIEYKFSISAIFTLLGLLITIISGAFHQLKISVTKPYFFAPEQFEACFCEIVSNSLSTTSKILKWVKGDKSITHLKKLVIVIDNIDRCTNDAAYNLLTDIKTFFSSEPYSIVFVIPVDDEALKNHILQNSKIEKDCNNEKEEFLRKFFNITLRIKPYGEADMYSFARQICEKSKIDFKPETINIASKEYAKNPRRVIQLFNNLLAEKNYYDTDFAEKNETLICCVLIIREEYPYYYKELVNSPKIFNENYSAAKDKDKDDVKRFVRIAQYTTGKVRVSDLSKILTNSYHQFDIIAADIKDAIDTFDTEKVLSIWISQKNDIENYIIDRFNDSIKNNFIDTELVGYFDMLMQININHPFEISFAKRIDEKALPFLSRIIEKTKNHEALCKYALLREQQQYKGIKRALIEDCENSEKEEIKEYFYSLFYSVLMVFQDKDTSMALSSAYTIHHGEIKDIPFSKEQISNLISDKFVKDRIEEFAVGDDGGILLNRESKEYQKLIWLFENKKNISADAYALFFEKVVGKNSDGSKMRGKSIDDIDKMLDFINPILNLIPDKKLTTQPQPLYNLIVSNRKMPHPSYPTSVHYDQDKNFIDDCLKGEIHIPDITTFVIDIYRITNNKTNTKNEIEKLLQYIELNKEFVQLINLKISLNPIIDLIFNAKDDFNSNDRLIVLKHCFNQKNDKGSYIIEDKNAKTKLDELLMSANDEQSTEIYKLLETLIEQEHYKKILTSVIIEKNKNLINKLPIKLLELAIDSFNKDTYSEFKNNFDFLSVIISKGNDTQKSYVVKILTEKLDEDEDIKSVLDLIDSMDNIPIFDKSKLLDSHLDNYQRRHKDDIAVEINEDINRLKKKVK